MQGTRARVMFSAVRAALVLATLCLGLKAGREDAGAAPSGTITMSPSDIYLEVGEYIAVTLILSAGQDIHGVHLVLGYDPGIVQVVDANAGQPGVQVLPGPFPASATPGTILQNTAGAGSIAYQYALPGNDTDAGTGTVATVQFQALANGNAGFAWQTAQLIDEDGVPASAAGSVASLVVGGGTPTPGATDTPTVGATPSETPTPATTATMGATETPTTAATSTSTAGASVTATVSPTGTPTPAATAPAVSATAKITVIQDSNQGRPPQSGVDPSQSERADGLPSAGNAGGGIVWWRWVFFMAALLFGIAGWFFTLAVYNNNKEVVLVDRFDKRRRRR